jgi:hypothetical protein
MLPVRSAPRQQSHLPPGGNKRYALAEHEALVRRSPPEQEAICQEHHARSFVPGPKHHDRACCGPAPRLYAKTKEVPVIVTKFG